MRVNLSRALASAAAVAASAQLAACAASGGDVEGLRLDGKGDDAAGGARDAAVVALTEADIREYVATHPALLAHLEAHPEAAQAVEKRLDEIFEYFENDRAPRGFFLGIGAETAYPFAQFVSFQTDVLHRTESGALRTQAMTFAGVKADALFSLDEGVIVGTFIEEDPDVTVTVDDFANHTVFLGTHLDNTFFAPSWTGDQYMLESSSALRGIEPVDLALGNAGIERPWLHALYFQSAQLVIHTETAPTILRDGNDEDIRWVEEPFEGAPAEVATDAGSLRFDGRVLSFAGADGTTWSAELGEGHLVAVDEENGRVTVEGEHVTWIVALADGTVESRVPFGARDFAGAPSAEAFALGGTPTFMCRAVQARATQLASLTLITGIQGQPISFFFGAWKQYYETFLVPLFCGATE